MYDACAFVGPDPVAYSARYELEVTQLPIYVEAEKDNLSQVVRTYENVWYMNTAFNER